MPSNPDPLHRAETHLEDAGRVLGALRRTEHPAAAQARTAEAITHLSLAVSALLAEARRARAARAQGARRVLTID